MHTLAISMRKKMLWELGLLLYDYFCPLFLTLQQVALKLGQTTVK